MSLCGNEHDTWLLYCSIVLYVSNETFEFAKKQTCTPEMIRYFEGLLKNHRLYSGLQYLHSRLLENGSQKNWTGVIIIIFCVIAINGIFVDWSVWRSVNISLPISLTIIKKSFVVAINRLEMSRSNIAHTPHKGKLPWELDATRWKNTYTVT